MANKRNASRELNHENWDDEEEPEASGKFQKAKAEVIAGRQIKVAKRRLKTTDDDASGTIKEEHLRTPSEKIFHNLGGNFASFGQDTKKATFYPKPTACRPVPVVSNTSPGLGNSPQSASRVETKIMDNEGIEEDNNSRPTEESPGPSAFRPVKPTNSPSQVVFRSASDSGTSDSESVGDTTAVKTHVVSPNYNTNWQKLTPFKPSQLSDPSVMPCIETKPVAEPISCAPSEALKMLAKKDSRHLLKAVPDDVLAQLKAKSEATGKSLNFLSRTYQLNVTTVDWLDILIKESLTVNIAEVMPSYMNELLKLIEEEIAAQETEEAKKQLLPHKNKLQHMLEVFRQYGYLSDDENSSTSEMLPEDANKASISKSPVITKKVESAPQSSNSPVVAHQDTPCKVKNTTPLKVKNTEQGVQPNVEKVLNESLSSASSHPSDEQDTEQTETDDDQSNTDSCTSVVEEGSICTMRCKVFVKKVLDPSDPFDTPYQNRGVGSLYIKPISCGKLQLLVRADNSLGNIILNTCITPDIPIEIANSNTLMLVCCPMPGDIARTVLIRVKNKVHVDLLHVNLVTI